MTYKDALTELSYSLIGDPLRPTVMVRTEAVVTAKKALKEMDNYRWHNTALEPEAIPTDGEMLVLCLEHRKVKDKIYTTAYRDGEAYYSGETGDDVSAAYASQLWNITGWKYIEEF